MKININGLDKVKVLMALYDNAKKSTYTQESIANSLWPDEFIFKQNRAYFQPKVDTAISTLELTEEGARVWLADPYRLSSIGLVSIKIDFSNDDIDTTSYDEDHQAKGGAKLALDIINALRSESNFKVGTKTQITSVGKGIAPEDTVKSLETSTQEAIQSLFHPTCKLFNSSYIGLSIIIPLDVPILEITGYADLLKSAGVHVKITPQSKLSVTTNPAKLTIKNETLESLNGKITTLLASKSSNSCKP
jgi:hypothetical protein